MNEMIKMAIGWALKQIATQYGDELKRLFGFSSVELSARVEKDPRGALDFLMPTISRIQAEQPEEWAKVENMIKQTPFAGVLGMLGKK